MLAKARRAVAEHGVGIIFIDYLQLIGVDQKFDTGEREVAAISKAIKQMARELDIPVVALSQLSRQVESRQDKRPLLSDLRNSGAIEQDADVVMMIYREAYYEPEADDVAEVNVAKQRNGPQGIVKLGFDKSRVRFRSLY